MKMLFETPLLEFTDIATNLYTERNIKLSVARLDKLHPIISGNKLFKLHFFLEAAMRTTKKSVLTFGGAYSNHLVATAYASKLAGLNAVGIVRGERPHRLSATLKACEFYGMQLQYMGREEYKNINPETFKVTIAETMGDCVIIPEGGYDPVGAKGAALIMTELELLKATHIATAVGTATTLSGLLQNRINEETIIAVPVIKNMTDINKRISFLNGPDNISDFVIFDEYHFGGYAKKTPALIDFMNDLYKACHLPTDIVYTSKMMYAVIDKIKSGYFKDGSSIVCLHTGGLQGNASLPAGTLVF